LIGPRYRDFRYVIPFMIQFSIFATPVVYPASLVPAGWRWLFHLAEDGTVIREEQEGFKFLLNLQKRNKAEAIRILESILSRVKA
jgi:hypothetical protein